MLWHTRDLCMAGRGLGHVGVLWDVPKDTGTALVAKSLCCREGMSVTQPVGHFPELGTLLLWEWTVAFRGGTVPPRCPEGELDTALGTVLEVRCPQG